MPLINSISSNPHLLWFLLAGQRKQHHNHRSGAGMNMNVLLEQFSLSAALSAAKQGLHAPLQRDATKTSFYYHIQSPKAKWSLVLFV